MAKFNIETPDDSNVKYYSYTASYKPGWFDIMRKSWQVRARRWRSAGSLTRVKVIHDIEGPNDGLVSTQSQRWGTVQGTLEDVNHRAPLFTTSTLSTAVDLIGWQAPYIFTAPRFRAASFFCSVRRLTFFARTHPDTRRSRRCSQRRASDLLCPAGLIDELSRTAHRKSVVVHRMYSRPVVHRNTSSEQSWHAADSWTDRSESWTEGGAQMFVAIGVSTAGVCGESLSITLASRLSFSGWPPRGALRSSAVRQERSKRTGSAGQSGLSRSGGSDQTTRRTLVDHSVRRRRLAVSADAVAAVEQVGVRTVSCQLAALR